MSLKGQIHLLLYYWRLNFVHFDLTDRAAIATLCVHACPVQYFS